MPRPLTPSSPRTTGSRRRPGLRHAVASGAAVVTLAGVIAVGLIAAPSGAAPAPTTPPELAADLPVIPLGTTTVSVPESGPALSTSSWRDAIGTAVVTAGATKLGAPYLYSAGGPDAFDCSGFVRWAWMQLGVELPHNSVAQWSVVESIPVSELRVGDLVFDSMGGAPLHVSLYVGDGVMLHAPNGGGVVRYDRVGWWTGARVTAGRVNLPR